MHFLRSRSLCCAHKRVHLTLLMLQEDGSDISPWHDIALYNEDGTLNFFCEIPMDTTAKFEVATVRLSLLSGLAAAATHAAVAYVVLQVPKHCAITALLKAEAL